MRTCRLQSGSDAVLRRMHRRYRPWHYAEKVEALVRAAGPELTLGADVMVGLSRRDGRRVRGNDGAGAGAALRLPAPVSVFAPAGNARAGRSMPSDPVPAAAVEERMAALRALAAEKSRAHRRRFVGRELEAITLHTPAELAARGRDRRADGELSCRWSWRAGCPPTGWSRVRVTGLDAEGVWKLSLP